MKKHRDIESMSDSIGLNINTHSSFGPGSAASSLTPIMIHQDSPEDIMDNIEKKV